MKQVVKILNTSPPQKDRRNGVPNDLYLQEVWRKNRSWCLLRIGVSFQTLVTLGVVHYSEISTYCRQIFYKSISEQSEVGTLLEYFVHPDHKNKVWKTTNSDQSYSKDYVFRNFLFLFLVWGLEDYEPGNVVRWNKGSDIKVKGPLVEDSVLWFSIERCS